MDVISKNIKDYRNKLDYTQGDIAIFLSITKEEVNDYETGKRSVPLKSLLKLSNLYDVTISNNNLHKAMTFKKGDFFLEDFDVLSQFVKVIKNHSKIKKLANTL